MNAKRALLLLLSVLFLYQGFRLAGDGNLLADLGLFPWWAVAGMGLALALNLALVSLRLGRLLSAVDLNLPYRVTLKASIQGHVASLFLISLVGQVAGRHLVLKAHGIPPISVAALTAVERALLAAVGAAMAFSGAAWLLDYKQLAKTIDELALVEMSSAACLSLILNLWLGKSGLISDLLGVLKSSSRISQLIESLLTTALAQSTVLGAFLIGAHILAPEAKIGDLLAAAAITSFAASLPISVNGWGVRELAAIFTFGHVGLPPSSAMALSITVGLCATAVVLLAAPCVLINHRPPQVDSPTPPSPLNTEWLETMAAWGVATVATTFVFFQLHVPVGAGVVNLNLADPFAMLALAAVIMNAVQTRKLPEWDVPGFNFLLLMLSVLLLLSFGNGLLSIGMTQWAFGGRLAGWLVLLGYLSIGTLTMTHLGRVGFEKMTQSLVVTGAFVIFFDSIGRSGAFQWLFDYSVANPNFQGFSANRNAFAFQLLICMALVFASSFRSRSVEASGQKRKLTPAAARHAPFILLCTLTTGLLLTGSRAGIITGALMFATFSIWPAAKRLELFIGAVTGLAAWGLTVATLPSLSTAFSSLSSDAQRWDSILRGLRMWSESPLFGAGLGVFVAKSTEWSSVPVVIHSTPVWLLAETGLAGGCCVLFALYKISVSVYRKQLPQLQATTLLLACGAFIVFGTVHEMFYQRIFWLVLGMCIAMSHDVRTSISSSAFLRDEHAPRADGRAAQFTKGQ